MGKNNKNNELARMLARRRAHVNRYTVVAPAAARPKPPPPPPQPRLTAAQVNAFWRELAPLLHTRWRLTNK